MLNEREVRAAAGILFFFAFASFMLAFLRGNFYATKIFVIVFLFDFAIRLFVNTKFAPSLILGRLATGMQRPEYVSARPKRFAWGLGFALAFLMFMTIVVFNAFSPLNAIVCLVCLVLLFFESAFGICMGCSIYHRLHKNEKLYCPGGVCEIVEKDNIQKVDVVQALVLVVSIFFLIALIVSGVVKKGKDLRVIYSDTSAKEATEMRNDGGAESGDCTPPAWAIKIGHGEIWKEHHGCSQ